MIMSLNGLSVFNSTVVHIQGRDRRQPSIRTVPARNIQGEAEKSPT